MNTSIEKNGLRIEINPQFLVIGGVNFSAGEADKVRNVLVWAARMQDLKALPPTVIDGPFTVTFSEDGNHKLTRNDVKNSSMLQLSFQFSQVDSLIDLINSGIEAYKTNLDVTAFDRLRARGRIGPVGSNHPDIIDGRS